MDTVTQLPGKSETTHIGVVGYVLLAGVALLALPLLPFLALVVLFDRLGSDDSEVSL